MKTRFRFGGQDWPEWVEGLIAALAYFGIVFWITVIIHGWS